MRLGMAKIAAVTVVFLLGSGGVASEAPAASLSVRVAPVRLHPGSRYTVTIRGSYDQRVRRRTYLLAFIQYSGKTCHATATGEYSLPASQWDWDFFPQRAETKSPFKDVAYWKASTRLGPRRVCAYLYAKPVSPTTTAKPLVRAGAPFSNARR
jgi:hypothetical protein